MGFLRCITILLAGWVYLNGPAAIAAYPEKPVQLIVGFSAGGNTDFLARLIAGRLSERLGQPVVVENRTGAEGMIAEEHVARADPDGYTLGYVINSHTIVPHIRKLSFDPIQSLSPVTLIESHPNVLVVPATLPVSTLKELVDLAKSEPGKLNFGSTGTGAPPYLMMALLMKDLGIQMTNINYQGTSPTIVALLGGEIQVAWASTETVAEHIKAGSVKPLAVSTNQRSPALPDVPTVAEAANLPSYDERVWQGIVVPAGTPRPVIDRLHKEVVEILKEPEIVGQFKSRGYFIIGSTPEEFDTFIRSETAKWGEILRGVKPQ